MARCVVLQHEEPEAPYLIGDALGAAGIELDVRRVFAGDPVPGTVDETCGLVVMGGPVSASSDEGFPSRRAELELIKAALADQVPVLGVCLGAQLLAIAAGGQVYLGERGAEIGWGTIELTEAAQADLLFGDLPGSLTVLHWHGDTFSLPPSAVWLAGSRRYRNQAFALHPSAWGLQFHVEVDVPAVEAFAAAFGHEAAHAGIDPAALAAEASTALATLAPYADRIMGRFAALVAGRRAGRSADTRDQPDT